MGDDAILAWHWTGDTLRDGRPIPPIGEVLRHDGPIELCVSGLHGSRLLIHSLRYAPGARLHRVALSGVLCEDKIVASERRIVAS